MRLKNSTAVSETSLPGLPKRGRQLIAKMRNRRFYLVNWSGQRLLAADVFLFRVEWQQHRERLLGVLQSGEVAVAGWFTEAELKKQLMFARRAQRERPDTKPEREAMFPATMAKPKGRGSHWGRQSWQGVS